MAAQAEFQGAHGRKAGVAADDTGGAQQQHTHAGAQGDGQHRAGKAKAWGEHGADLQHHQADAEGEPQREQVAGAEDALVGGDRVVGGELAGGGHCHVRQRNGWGFAEPLWERACPAKRLACRTRWRS